LALSPALLASPALHRLRLGLGGFLRLCVSVAVCLPVAGSVSDSVSDPIYVGAALKGLLFREIDSDKGLGEFDAVTGWLAYTESRENVDDNG